MLDCSTGDALKAAEAALETIAALACYTQLAEQLVHAVDAGVLAGVVAEGGCAGTVPRQLALCLAGELVRALGC